MAYWPCRSWSVTVAIDGEARSVIIDVALIPPHEAAENRSASEVSGRSELAQLAALASRVGWSWRPSLLVAATPSIWPWRLMMEARLGNSDQVGAPAPVALRASNLMRSVNSNMRQISGTLTESELLPFFCECRTPTCYSVVWMSVGAFDATVATERGWMLLDGHEPSALWHRRDPLPTRQTVRSRSAPLRRAGSFGPREDPLE
jgi:hypothetical protein